ncbi:hypothetical protein JW835_11740 [bacterium]|nr:hypothetical protein [bacterium]
MKTKKMIFPLIAFFLPLFLISGSPVFTVRLGPKMQSSQVGFQVGPIQPYIGLDYMSMGFNANVIITNSHAETDTSIFITDYKIDSDIEGNVRIWMPHIGVRYYINNHTTKPYLFAGIFKSFASIDAGADFDNTYYDENGNIDFTASESEKLDKETVSLLEDLLGIWGLNFGLGAEYTVNEHFSIGGEFGFKYAKTSTSSTNEAIESVDYSDYYTGDYYSVNISDGYNEYSGMNDQGAIKTVTKTDVTAGLTFSYAAVCLNFHF